MSKDNVAMLKDCSMKLKVIINKVEPKQAQLWWIAKLGAEGGVGGKRAGGGLLGIHKYGNLGIS